jgi:hypothetical protein
MNTPELSFTTPTELLAAIPHLLGFVPTNDMVALMLGPAKSHTHTAMRAAIRCPLAIDHRDAEQSPQTGRHGAHPRHSCHPRRGQRTPPAGLHPVLRVTFDDDVGVIGVDEDGDVRTAPLGVVSGAVVGVVTGCRSG